MCLCSRTTPSMALCRGKSAPKSLQYLNASGTVCHMCLCFTCACSDSTTYNMIVCVLSLNRSFPVVKGSFPYWLHELTKRGSHAASVPPSQQMKEQQCKSYLSAALHPLLFKGMSTCKYKSGSSCLSVALTQFRAHCLLALTLERLVR